ILGRLRQLLPRRRRNLLAPGRRRRRLGLPGRRRVLWVLGWPQPPCLVVGAARRSLAATVHRLLRRRWRRTPRALTAFGRELLRWRLTAFSAFRAS
ncbi:hypothetical protein, partial [Amycolatopsis alba]|uniref:hypothetical protein n=1 Tax=Amycolatopsis alba TaxID=76020 RepID=UPI00146FB062